VKALKEPLLHFLLAGAAMFAAYAWINRPSDMAPTSAGQIHLRAGDAQWLADNWTRQWRRPPTDAELRGLLTDHLNEQLLAREARALRLDEDDAVVRRWLAQKLTFLIDGTLRRSEPGDEELRRYYTSNSERYQSEARVSFTHVFFNPLRRADARGEAVEALQVLRASASSGAGGDLGDRLLIDAEMHDQAEQTISGLFGRDFARSVLALPPGEWSGPVKSEYGLHLVRPSSLTPAERLPFDAVRARVVEDWTRDQEALVMGRYLAELRKKYDVVVEDSVRPLLAPPADARAPAR
jgi:hypothetical protein